MITLCDIGNTSYHFLKGDVSFKKSVNDFDPRLLEDEVFYISVNSEVNKTLKYLKNWIDISSHIDMDDFYETMGIDRVVASKAIDNGVIVDAGSAITVDVIKDGIFQGGFIYPGVNAMNKTYKDISDALSYEFNFECDMDKLPKNSQDAISYGFLKTLQREVLSYNMPIILTGGDADKFKKIFVDAEVDEILIFKGMKKLLSPYFNDKS